MEKPGLGAQKPRKIPVDKRFFLYLYTNLSLNGYSSIMNPNHTDCSRLIDLTIKFLFQLCIVWCLVIIVRVISRPYFLKRINYTNLNLLLVRANHSACDINVDVEPVEIQYSLTEDGKIPACNKIMMNSYPRKKLLGCSDKRLLVNIIFFFIFLLLEFHFSRNSES